MSTIINADTSDGLKFTSDTSGEIKLQSAGADIATLNTSGADFVDDITVNGLTVGKGANAVATNTAVGYQSLLDNTTGASNTAIGREALANNTTASNNTAVGYQALHSNVTGANNAAFGYRSLTSNTSNFNTGFGLQTLYLATTASENTAIGRMAGGSTTTGVANTYLGNHAGNWSTLHTTGSTSVFIGNKTSPAAGGDSGTIVIGAGYVGKGSNTGFISPGGGGVYQGNNSSSWSTISDRRLKKNIVDNTTGLELIKQVQVKNYEYRTKDEVTDLPQDQAIDKQGTQLGVVAQELQEVLPDMVKEETTGVLRVDPDNMTWYLVNAVKELSAKVDALQTEINVLKGE